MIKRHHISLKNAWAGVVWAFHTQPNFKVHLVLSAIALLACLYLRVSSLETIVIISVVVFGLIVEMINTAIEEATDAITSDFKEEIKIAKDVAAGAMLIYAIGAVVIAVIIFGPRIVALLN